MANDPNTERQRILKILDCMRDTEIDLITFIEGIMISSDPRFKKIAATFLDRGGFEIVLRFMLRSLGFGKAKHSTRCLTAVNKALGSEIWIVISEILELEISSYCKSPEAGKTAGTITPESVEQFSLMEMRKNFECHCPRLSKIMGLICRGCKSDAMEEKEVSGEPEEPEVPEVLEVLEEDSLPSTKKRRLATKSQVPVHKKRRVRDKSLIGTICLGVLAFGHSRNANLFQMIMGYYMHSYSVAKEVVCVLNRLGITVAYNTVCESMNTMAECNWRKIRQRIQDGEAFGYAIDNCVIGDNKAEQSLLNRKETLQYTAGFLWFLNLPCKTPRLPVDEASSLLDQGSIVGQSSATSNATADHAATSTPATGAPVTPLDPIGDPAVTQTPATAAPATRCAVPEGGDFPNSLHVPAEYHEAVQDLEGGVAGKGIDRKILFREIPDYEGIDSLWALSIDSLSEYMPSRAVVHLSDVLWEFFPEVLRKMKDVRPTICGGYQIPLHRSQVHGMKTQPIDESTIPGISDILDASLVELDINKYEAMDRGWFVAGDLFTLIKIEALQNVRVRDFRYNRHEYVLKLPGAFHLEMAAEDALFRAHWGREDGMDPGSLCHLKHVLGLKGITATKAEYNTCKRFTAVCAKSFALAAFCEILGAESLEELKTKLQQRGEYVAMVEEVVQKLFIPRLARVARENGEAGAQIAWDNVLKRRRVDRAPEELVKKTFMKGRACQERDVVYENYLLFLQQAFRIWDLHWNVRNGHSGGFWKNIQVLAVWFNGCGCSHTQTNSLLINT